MAKTMMQSTETAQLLCVWQKLLMN